MEDAYVLFLSLLAKTITFGVAGVSLYWIGVYYDRRNNIDWKRVYDGMEKSPSSMSRYFGLRILAFAILAAWIYG